MRRINLSSVLIFHIIQLHYNLTRRSEIIRSRFTPITGFIKQTERNTTFIIITQFYGHSLISRQIKSTVILPPSETILSRHQCAGVFVECAFLPYRRIEDI